MSCNTWKLLGLLDSFLQNKNKYINITTVTSQKLTVVDKSVIKCEAEKNQYYDIEFIIVKISCETILDLKTYQELNLIKRV